MANTALSNQRPPVLYGVARDTVGQDNGAMRNIPGSHQRGSFRHTTDLSNALTLNQVADPSQFDENTAQYIELQPGQVSLHDIGVLHGSAANNSGRPRTTLHALDGVVPT